eukprot:scaffold49777_cov47-Prasinocladus_malaysianus.AAC.1
MLKCGVRKDWFADSGFRQARPGEVPASGLICFASVRVLVHHGFECAICQHPSKKELATIFTQLSPLSVFEKRKSLPKGCAIGIGELLVNQCPRNPSCIPFINYLRYTARAKLRAISTYIASRVWLRRHLHSKHK